MSTEAVLEHAGVGVDTGAASPCPSCLYLARQVAELRAELLLLRSENEKLRAENQRLRDECERLMKEIRRRTKVAEQFPNEQSALLLVTARLRRIHECWAERRYLDMAPLYELEHHRETQAAVA